MVSHRIVLLAVLSAGLPFAFAACSSSQVGPGEYCGSSDPCGCIKKAPGKTCRADGMSCTCTSNPDDSGPNDAQGTPDAPPADMAAFAGRWSPVSGSGEANCSGQITPLPPNPSAILTFTQDSPSTLTATSSGAAGCTLELLVSGETASLAQSSETCAVPSGGSVAFSTFHLVFIPAAGAGKTHAGIAPDGVVDASGAESSTEDAGTDGAPQAEDAGTDGAPQAEDAGTDGPSSSVDAGADGAPSAGDTGTDGGPSSADAGAPPPQDTLDWQLADTEGSCVTTLHYTLARAAK